MKKQKWKEVGQVLNLTNQISFCIQVYFYNNYLKLFKAFCKFESEKALKYMALKITNFTIVQAESPYQFANEK